MDPTFTKSPKSHTPLPKSRPISLLPSPLLNDDAASSEGYEGELLHDLVYSDQRQHHISSPSSPSFPQNVPKFNPFFTLIEDTTSGEHHHPSIHYIFSDDDPDVITDAILHTLSPDSTSNQEIGGSSVSNKSHERYLLVDISATGDQIVSAKSLATDWQILETQISAAPTFDGESGPDGGEAGLLLKIEGVENKRDEQNDLVQEKWNESKMKSGGNAWGALKSLEEKVRREMEALRRVEGQTEPPQENRAMKEQT